MPSSRNTSLPCVQAKSEALPPAAQLPSTAAALLLLLLLALPLPLVTTPPAPAPGTSSQPPPAAPAPAGPQDPRAQSAQHWRGVVQGSHQPGRERPGAGRADCVATNCHAKRQRPAHARRAGAHCRRETRSDCRSQGARRQAPDPPPRPPLPAAAAHPRWDHRAGPGSPPAASAPGRPRPPARPAPPPLTLCSTGAPGRSVSVTLSGSACEGRSGGGARSCATASSLTVMLSIEGPQARRLVVKHVRGSEQGGGA